MRLLMCVAGLQRLTRRAATKYDVEMIVIGMPHRFDPIEYRYNIS